MNSFKGKFHICWLTNRSLRAFILISTGFGMAISTAESLAQESCTIQGELYPTFNDACDTNQVNYNCIFRRGSNSNFQIIRYGRYGYTAMPLGEINREDYATSEEYAAARNAAIEHNTQSQQACIDHPDSIDNSCGLAGFDSSSYFFANWSVVISEGDPCETGGWNGSSCVIATTCAAGSKTQEECPVTRVANPIDYRDGVKYETKVDYTSGGDTPLTVKRHYSSSGSVGAGYWRFSYSGVATRHLEFPAGAVAGDVWVNSADQTTLIFTSNDGVNYYSDSDVITRLYKIGDGWRIVSKGDGIEEFDSLGRLTYVSDRDGRSHNYSYIDNTIVVSDYAGRSLLVSLNSAERPSSITLPDSSTLTYTYNSGGVLETVTYADSTSIQYHYEGAPGLLTGITDERGIRYATFGYDASGKANLSEHAGGVDSYGIAYNGLNSTVTNPLGKTTNHLFEIVQGAPKLKASGRLASAHCGAAAASYEYDTNGFVSEKVDWEGNITEYIKDSRGLAAVTTYAKGTADERQISTQWHSEFRLPEVITEPGRATSYTYSPYTNPNYTQKTVTDTSTGASRTWSYTYNSLGQVLTVDGPRSDVTDTATYTYYNCAGGSQCGQIHSVTNGLNQVTTYNTYDIHGYPTQFTDANGVITTIAYDLRQRPTSVTVDSQVTTITYEPTGDVQRVTLADGTYSEYVRDDANRLIALFDGQGNRIDWTLDNAGNRTDEQIKDPNGQIRKSLQTQYDELSRVRGMIYAHGGSSTYVYDSNDNQIQHTDASDRVSTSEYDALDRVIKDIDAIAGETLYTYDDRDNLTTVTDPEGLTTTYTYNAFDEVVREESPDTGTTSYTYDSAGNRVTQTDARGVTATYSYDALNRLTQISYPDSSEDITYIYDEGANGVGRLTQITDVSGTTDYGYDARGNTTSVTQTVGGQSYTQTYTYNGANRLIGMTYPSGRTITYSHDTSGRINQIASVGNEGAETLADAIARLPFGPVSSLTLGNGIERTRIYDQDYRVENLTDGSVFAKGLAYSAVNNITAITDNVDTNLNQLFIYDDLDRLNFATGNYGEDTYSYDGIGNRLSFTRGTQSESYDYGGTSHRLQSVSGQSYQYDAVGNTVNNGATTFSYNNRNRLVSATANGTTTDYQHNALGQRVVKGSGDDQTHYVYDLEGRLIAEARGGTVTVEYAYLDGEPLVMWREDEGPSVPGSLTLISPLETVSSATPTFEWADVGTADTYRLRIYDRLLKSWVHLENYAAAEICNNGVCTVTPVQVSLGFAVNHQWSVRARNSQGWNDWAENQRFDYVDTPPGAIIPISPLLSTETATPDYSWEDPGNVTDFRLLIYDRLLRTQVHNEQYSAESICSAGVCGVTPVGLTLNYSTNHFWRVRAKNSGGWNDWSDPHQFDYVDTPPGAITLISPLVSTETATPEYSWENPGNVTDFRLLIYDRLLKTQVHNEQYSAESICSVGRCGITPPGLALNYSKNHFWRIRAKNSGGWNDWSDPQRFDYVDTVPDIATPVSPTGSISNPSPTYSWTGPGNAVEYQVLLYDRVLRELIHNERYAAAEICANDDCAISPSVALSEGSNHFWRVRAGNSGGWSEWSERIAFDVIGGGQ